MRKRNVHSKLENHLNTIGQDYIWLANELEINKSTTYRWCRNNEYGYAISTPSVGHLIVMLDLLDCQIKDLFELIE